jgi:hypothetical protein
MESAVKNIAAPNNIFFPAPLIGLVRECAPAAAGQANQVRRMRAAQDGQVAMARTAGAREFRSRHGRCAWCCASAAICGLNTSQRKD